jgi:DNA adenine methylase
MKKLFKWPGGKKQETKRIVELLPQTIDTVVEPFAGSAAIAFHLEKKSVINDLDKDISNFYEAIADPSDYSKIDSLIRNAYSNIPFARKDDPNRANLHSLEDEFYKQRDILNNKDYSKRAEAAYAFFIIRQLCFSGMLRVNEKTKNFNVPYGWYKKFTNNLTQKHHDFLKNKTVITCEDYKKCIRANDKKDNFIFIDPPYRNRAGYPVEEWNDRHHVELFHEVANIKHANWMIVHCEDVLYESLYQKFNIKSNKFNYNIAFKDRNKVQRKVNHLYITNY